MNRWRLPPEYPARYRLLNNSLHRTTTCIRLRTIRRDPHGNPKRPKRSQQPDEILRRISRLEPNRLDGDRAVPRVP